MSENKTAGSVGIVPAEDGSIKVVVFSAPKSPPLLGAKAASGAKNAPVEDVTVAESGASIKEFPEEEPAPAGDADWTVSTKEFPVEEPAPAAAGIDEWKTPSPFRKGESNLVDRSKKTTKILTSIGRVDPNGFAALLGTDVDEEDFAVVGSGKASVDKEDLAGVGSGAAFVDDAPPSSAMSSGAVEETEPTSTRSGLRFGKFCSTKLLCVFLTVMIGLGCSAFALSSYSSGGVSELFESVFVPDAASVPVVDFSNATPEALNPTKRGTTFESAVDPVLDLSNTTPENEFSPTVRGTVLRRSPLFSSLPHDMCSVEQDNVFVDFPIPQPTHTRGWHACDDLIFPPAVSTHGTPPAVWQDNNCYGNPNADSMFDFALVGAGIGSSYVVNQVRYQKDHMNTIALFEAGQIVGGRLASSFQAGAYGPVTRPYSKLANVAPVEYGGMRVAPRYPLIFKQVIQIWDNYFKADQHYGESAGNFCSIEECKTSEDPVKCCPGVLRPMNVGNVRYAYDNRNSNQSWATLGSAKITQPNPLYTTTNGLGSITNYTVENIQRWRTFYPYVQCILLAVGVGNITKTHPDGIPKEASAGFDKACSSSYCSAIVGMCDLCHQFPVGLRAAAVVSCTGYDVDPDTQTVDGVIGLADEVVNIEGNTHLYLFVNGYQRLAQSLLQGTYEKPDAQSYAINDVAPSFQKKLIAIGIGNGSFEQSVERANCLATKQAARFSGVQSPPAPQCGPVDPKEPIRMKFEDGSFTSSSIAYLTPLPYDMLAIDGMQPWCEVIKKVAVPNLAFKANLV